MGWAIAFSLFVGTYASVMAQDVNVSAQTATTTTTAQAGTSTGKELVISAAKWANHTILFRALRVSGLTEQASGKETYTVFAPTNEAFGKLPAVNTATINQADGEATNGIVHSIDTVLMPTALK